MVRTRTVAPRSLLGYRVVAFDVRLGAIGVDVFLAAAAAHCVVVSGVAFRLDAFPFQLLILFVRRTDTFAFFFARFVDMIG